MRFGFVRTRTSLRCITIFKTFLVSRFSPWLGWPLVLLAFEEQRYYQVTGPFDRERQCAVRIEAVALG